MLKRLNLILAFLVCGISFAQNPPQQPSNVEIVIGPTLSKIFGEDLEATDFIFGLQGGLLLNVPTNAGSMRIGALYTQKGFGADDGIDLKLNYLTVPIHLGISTPTGAQFYFGPELNFLLSSTISNGKVTEKIEEGLSKGDLSIAGGVRLPLSDRVFMSFGVSVGMIKVLETNGYKKSHVGNNLSIPINLSMAL